MNNVFATLLAQRIGAFRTAYSEVAKAVFVDPSTGRPSHSGEYGGYREAILRDFIRFFVPGHLNTGTGFLLSPDGGVSTQLDIVLFESASAPQLESTTHQRFFPIEVVAGIGEAKSSLTKTELRDALNKLAIAKQITERLAEAVPIRRDAALRASAFDRSAHAYDQVASFLVCDHLKFDAQTLADEVDEMYDPALPRRCRHNLILSLRDGLLAYVDHNQKTMMYPVIRGNTLRNRFVRPDTNQDVHILFFASYLFMMMTSATILYPGMTAYMPPTEGGWNHDQNAVTPRDAG